MSNEHKYDNAVEPDNKFGHTLALMERHLGADRGEPGEGIHLDLACGYGHIAGPIADQFGLHYVGVDVDDTELEELRARGLEAHAVDLQDPRCGEVLRKIVDGRRLVSVTFLDGLEHLTDGSHALAALGELLSEHRAIAVTSVPNVTHVDVGIKTILGSWDYTEAGLLDRTHYQLYSQQSLLAAMRRAGLSCFDTYDVTLAQSDQHFPLDHTGIAETTAFSQFLRTVRDDAEPHGLVNQFVWALTAVPPVPVPLEPEVERSDLFLSVIMRTQGRRSQELREALLCLAGQSSDDFEVLIVAHKTTVPEQKSVEAIIEDQPPFLREKIRLVLLDHGPRSAPLNLGIDEARGRYVAIFDDDDIVMGDWVSEFKAAEREHGGRMLRTVALRQAAGIDTVCGVRAIRSTGGPIKKFSSDFSLTEHLVENQSPPISWIFPRSLAVDFGLRYDESMTTTEDWEFLIRAAELAGVTDVGRVTAIYRWWDKRESSRTLHKMDEWAQNQREIERRIDARPLLLPAGETRELRKELLELRALTKHTQRQQKRIERLEKTLSESRAGNRRLRSQLRKASGQVEAGSTGTAPATTAQPGRLRRALRPRTRLRSLRRRLGGS